MVYATVSRKCASIPSLICNFLASSKVSFRLPDNTPETFASLISSIAANCFCLRFFSNILKRIISANEDGCLTGINGILSSYCSASCDRAARLATSSLGSLSKPPNFVAFCRKPQFFSIARSYSTRDFNCSDFMTLRFQL